MSTIHIHREHKLGMAKARKIAWAWAEQVDQHFGMECTVYEGEDSDTIELTRSGDAEVGGRSVDLAVSRLRAKLGEARSGQPLIRTLRGEGSLFDVKVDT